jgi:type IV pilus assembly protein PilC
MQSVDEDVKLQKKKKKKGGEVYFSAVSPLDVALSIRHLSLMLRSGMPLTDGLEVIVDQAADKRLQDAYADIRDQVSGGTSMAKAMGDHPKIFPHVIRSVVDVGEQGGTLENNLIFLADFLKQSHELSRKVKGAMTYPMIVGGLTVVEMLGVIFYIMPQLDSLFSSFENIPAFTRMLMDSSKFIQENVFLMLGIGFVIWLVQFFYFKTKVGIRTKEKISLSFPIVKDMNQKHILTSFSRTLGILLESGIPIVKALEISGDTVGNSLYSEVLRKVAEDVKGGTSVAQALEKYPKFFPATFTKMINIGEETGTLEENLMFLHEFYSEEVTEMASNLTTLMEPILLIFIGAMIGLLALTIISPIYQLTGSINSQ